MNKQQKYKLHDAEKLALEIERDFWRMAYEELRKQAEKIIRELKKKAA